MGKMLGGEEEKDPDAQKKEEERQEALRQQEEERKAKYARMEAERENIRQGIRDKVNFSTNRASRVNHAQRALIVLKLLSSPQTKQTAVQLLYMLTNRSV